MLPFKKTFATVRKNNSRKDYANYLWIFGYTESINAKNLTTEPKKIKQSKKVDGAILKTEMPSG
jgi:hypothetical protein